jgi:hypothetical protein
MGNRALVTTMQIHINEYAMVAIAAAALGLAYAYTTADTERQVRLVRPHQPLSSACDSLVLSTALWTMRLPQPDCGRGAGR